MPDFTIRTLMTTAPPSIGPKDTVRRALMLLRATNTAELLVMDGGKLVGTLNERDIWERCPTAMVVLNEKQADELPAKLRAALPVQDPCEYLIQNAPRERLAELDLDLAKFTAWAGLAQSLLTLGRSYVPSGAVKSMTVFYAHPLRGTKQDWLTNQLHRWDAFARMPNRYVDVPGEHHTLMGAKHVPKFQAVLKNEINRALRGH